MRIRAPALELDRLTVRYRTSQHEVEAVSDLSLSIGEGECLGVVGPSGAGKSQAFLAAMGLLPENAQVTGSVRLGGVELLTQSRPALDRLRAARIAMVFQDSVGGLTPHMRIGDQIAEARVRHRNESWRVARERARSLLDQLHVDSVAQRMSQYPHELSGGLSQRVMIALALACDPAVLIADEPTTSLDVILESRLLSLLAEIRRQRNMAVVLITHDLNVVAGLADQVAVMNAGRLVKQGAVADLKRETLVNAGSPRPDISTQSVMSVSGLTVDFAGRPQALSDVSFDLFDGEALGIIGESASGKTTLVRSMLQLLKPTKGEVVWLGQPLHKMSAATLRPLRRDLQIIFQDATGSLNPMLSVREIVAEPLLIHRPELPSSAVVEAVAQIMERVGLSAAFASRRPRELSGGECQRVAIARAMILRPKLLVCDEPLSSLDSTLQGQMLDLIESLRREQGTTIVFVSHSLALVRRLCDRVLVVYRGRMVELAPTAELFAGPRHPHTRQLLEATRF